MEQGPEKVGLGLSLGHIRWNRGNRIEELLNRINGQVHLICGNHDKILNAKD